MVAISGAFPWEYVPGSHGTNNWMKIVIREKQ